jgi:hypothetical protein
MRFSGQLTDYARIARIEVPGDAGPTTSLLFPFEACLPTQSE